MFPGMLYVNKPSPAMTHLRLITCFLGLTLLFSASQAQSPEGTGGGASDIPSTYIIQPLDIFRVTIFQHPDLLTEVRVARDGTVILPLIGKITVGGMTILDVQRMIQSMYEADYLVNPHVNIMMLQYTERRIQVHGQVNNPGPVIIPPEETMTLSQAISAARGLTRLADARDIRLKRAMPDGSHRVIRINFSEILKDPSAKDIEVFEGDDIFVTERIF